MSRPHRRDHRARRLGIETLEDRRVLATVTVSTASDVVDTTATSSIAALIANPGLDGKISLREAIEAANFDQSAPSDTIQFAADLSNARITLTQGELSITDGVTIEGTIDGAGPSQVSLGITIDAGGGTNGIVGDFDGHSIFDIFLETGHVEINSLTLTGGDAAPPRGTGGAISLVFFNATAQG